MTGTISGGKKIWETRHNGGLHRKVCPTCKKLFQPRQARDKYCSRECFFATIDFRAKGQIGLTDRIKSGQVSDQARKAWKTMRKKGIRPPELKSKVCPDCEKLFIPKYYSQTYCSRQCAGRHNLTYIDGRTKDEKHNPNFRGDGWQAKRKLVLERDNHECDFSHLGECKGKLNVHELINYHDNHKTDSHQQDIGQMITLCSRHHRVVEAM